MGSISKDIDLFKKNIEKHLLPINRDGIFSSEPGYILALSRSANKIGMRVDITWLEYEARGEEAKFGEEFNGSEEKMKEREIFVLDLNLDDFSVFRSFIGKGDDMKNVGNDTILKYLKLMNFSFSKMEYENRRLTDIREAFDEIGQINRLKEAISIIRNEDSENETKPDSVTDLDGFAMFTLSKLTELIHDALCAIFTSGDDKIDDICKAREYCENLLARANIGSLYNSIIQDLKVSLTPDDSKEEEIQNTLKGLTEIMAENRYSEEMGFNTTEVCLLDSLLDALVLVNLMSGTIRNDDSDAINELAYHFLIEEPGLLNLIDFENLK